MRELLVAGALLTAACGRIGFDSSGDGGASGGERGPPDGGGFIGGRIHYIKPSNTAANQAFGAALAMSADGNTLAVGAYAEDASLADSGAVYIFVRSGTTWIEQAYLKSLFVEASANYGTSVGLSANGDILAVGAFHEHDGLLPEAGAVYVYLRQGSAWSTPFRLSAPANAGGSFGQSLSISADGHTLAIGASSDDVAGTNSGAAYVFRFDDVSWQPVATLRASNPGASDYFGESIALSGDGRTLAIGAYLESSSASGIDGDGTNDDSSGSGAVYVFTENGSWTQQAYVKSALNDQGEELGISVALSDDGNVLLAGASLEDGAARGVDGNIADRTAPLAGAAYVLERSGRVWTHRAYLKASNTDAGDLFGLRVALSGDGATIAVGAVREQSDAVGIGGDQARNVLVDAGAAYVFARGGPSWIQRAYVKELRTTPTDGFGTPALSGNGSTLAVGAYTEDSDAVGVDSTGVDDAAVNSGAVYIYE